MSVNPNQGQGPDPYGAYQGYTPPSQPSDPYSSQQYGQQQQGGYQQPDTGYRYGQQQQQEQPQYNTYQPPLASGARNRQGSAYGNATGSTSGLKPNMAAFLGYLFWWVGGLVFLLIERSNKFVRFNAAQSFAFLGSTFVVTTILHFLAGFFGGIPLIGFLFAFLFNIVSFVILVPVLVVWVFLMFQAYRGVSVRLPFFGDIADKIEARIGGGRSA